MNSPLPQKITLSHQRSPFLKRSPFLAMDEDFRAANAFFFSKVELTRPGTFDDHFKTSQLDIFSESAPQFSMYTSDTLEAHAPGSITTLRSSDTETETQPQSCLGMTAHHPGHTQQCFTTLQDSDSRQSPAPESQTFVHAPSDDDTQATHTIHSRCIHITQSVPSRAGDRHSCCFLLEEIGAATFKVVSPQDSKP